MTSCPDPLNPPREVLDRLIDLVAWAKTCLLIAITTSPGSPERKREVAGLKEAVVEPRRITNEILGRKQALPQAVLVELRGCELAISRLEAGAVSRQPPPHGDAS